MLFKMHQSQCVQIIFSTAFSLRAGYANNNVVTQQLYGHWGSAWWIGHLSKKWKPTEYLDMKSPIVKFTQGSTNEQQHLLSKQLASYCFFIEVAFAYLIKPARILQQSGYWDEEMKALKVTLMLIFGVRW